MYLVSHACTTAATSPRAYPAPRPHSTARTHAAQGRVAAYGSTPYWLAGSFALFPRIEPLAMLVGLYSIWLFVMGLPAVTKAPRDKNAAYTLLTSIAAVLLVLVITAIITRLVVS